MNALTVSVVVVSRHRPDALRLCLTGLLKVNADPFEVIVVGDPTAIAVAQDVHGDIKAVLFDEPNISRARNLGIDRAGGAVVAFVDDDAVPEPQWLAHLTAQFRNHDVAAAGGFVIGRNGISFQWKARLAFADGTATPFQVEDPTIFQGEAGRAIKTEGTNMAFRRDVLVGIGGFDPRFHYYLDETDVNMRLAAAGAKTAIVPLAQVHHGFAASRQRTQSRAPRSLYDVAASSAIFSRKHDPANIEQNGAELRRRQRLRLLRFMVAGALVPGDVARLMKTFDAGWADGLLRQDEGVTFGEMPPLFAPVIRQQTIYGHVVVSGRSWQKGRVLAKARKRAAEKNVSVYIFSPTALFHRVSFDKGGFWVQRGGLFGRSVRSQKLFRFWTFERRVEVEATRVNLVRENPKGVM